MPEFRQLGLRSHLAEFCYRMYIHLFEHSDLIHFRADNHIRFFDLEAKFGDLAVGYIGGAHKNIKCFRNAVVPETRNER